MQTIMNNTVGLGLILRMNWDRFFYIGTLVAALGAGTWIGTLTTQ